MWECGGGSTSEPRSGPVPLSRPPRPHWLPAAALPVVLLLNATGAEVVGLMTNFSR